MRVAIAIHADDLDKVLETYHMMSVGYIVHSSPLLIRAGSPFQQTNNNFSLPLPSSKVSDIFKCVADCAAINASSGAVGLNINALPVTGSVIISIHELCADRCTDALMLRMIVVRAQRLYSIS